LVYKIQSKSTVAVACFLPGRAKDLSAPLYEIKREQQYREKYEKYYSQSTRTDTSCIQ